MILNHALLLTVVAAAAADECSILQRGPAQSTKQAVERFHVLSLGRDGSTFTLRLFWNNTPTLFEPLRYVYTGEELLTFSKSRMNRSLQCLYDCHRCMQGDVNSESLELLGQHCRGKLGSGPLVLKTIRVADLGLLPRALPKAALETTRFLVLIRDPRPRWISARDASLRVSPRPLFCKVLALQILTLPELASAVGTHLHIEVYEKWITDEVGFSARVAQLAEVEPTRLEDFARTVQAPSSFLQETPRWPTEMSAAQLWELESDPSCRAYMLRAGYKFGSSDTSGLKSPSELVAPLTADEGRLLAELRRLQSA